MAPRPRNSKGTNVPTAAFEPVEEDEVASRQRNEIPLMEHEVQELDTLARMAEMMKHL